MLQLFSRDIYVLLDLCSTLSYVSPYVVLHLGFGIKNISNSFLVSTLVGKSIISRRIYRGCVVSILHRDMVVDLVELDMIDFDIIFKMN